MHVSVPKDLFKTKDEENSPEAVPVVKKKGSQTTA
jgi:hypothetical protein